MLSRWELAGLETPAGSRESMPPNADVLWLRLCRAKKAWHPKTDQVILVQPLRHDLENRSMKRLLLGVICALSILLAPAPAADQESPASAKAALQLFNDYIGTWSGRGDQDKAKPDLKAGWSETVDWSWRFKGDDAWLVMKIRDGK